MSVVMFLAVGCGEAGLTNTSEQARPCGPGTTWDGAQCVVASDDSRTGPTDGSLPDAGGADGASSAVDLELTALTPGPCSSSLWKKAPGASDFELVSAEYSRYGYAADGALTHVDTVDENGGWTPFILLTYTADGKVASRKWIQSKATVTHSFEYDAEGRIKRTTERLDGSAASVQFWREHGYDSNGRIASIARTSSSPNEAAFTMHYAEQPDGSLLVSVDNGSPVNRLRFNSALQLTTLTVLDSSQQDDGGWIWTYENGRNVALTSIVAGSNPAPTRTYAFDSHGNIAYTTAPWISAGSGLSKTVYDYACWKGVAIPAPKSRCAAGGSPDMVTTSCWTRLVDGVDIY